MIIQKIESFLLRIPFRSGTRSDAAAWGEKDLPASDSLLVKVTTDQGLEGWGEAFALRGVSSAKAAVDGLVAPLCIGRDPAHIAQLMLDVQKKLHVFGRGGSLMYAISALDIALWDIAGKAANAPVCQLLGGAVADLPCYASLVRFSEAALVRANVRRALDGGFRAVKLHEVSVPAVAAAREEAGPDIELMLDVNCPWTLNEARKQARDLRTFNLKWLEEPVWPPENFDGLAALRKGCGIPIAAGENISTLMDFERLMRSGSVDFVQPSPAKMGGITELCKVFSIASIHGVAVMPHSFYDGPGLLAAIHATAACGTTDSMIEWRCFDLEAQIFGDALAPVDGRVQVPQRPGLGVDPDPDVIRTYRQD